MCNRVQEIQLNHNELERKFLFRLKTQDRIYSDFVFPIRVLTKILSDQNEKTMPNWFYKGLQNMEIHTESRIFEFKQLTLLQIHSNGLVHVKFDNDDCFYTLYTQVARKNRPPRPMIVNALSDITIDHIIPMFRLFDNYETDYPYLTKLSNLILDWAESYNGDFTRKNTWRWSNDFFMEKQDIICDPIFKVNLWKELEKMNPQYRLLERKENSRFLSN